MANISSSNSLGERVPKLRFPGFEGGWVCEKLSDFTERVTRKNTNNETELPLTISSKDGLVDQISYFNKTVASKDMSGYYLLKHGEYAYNKSYSVGYSFGSIKRLDRYAMGALSTLYICFTLKKHNTDFVNTYFDSLKWYHEIHMISAEGARNHGLLNIPTEVFFETKHWLPINLDEQEKIAKFFQLLEHKIEIQQNLLDALKLYKRGLLSKLFLQKGESVPQYRFTGFTDAWEQRKVTELGDIYIGLVTTMTAHYTDHGALLIRNSDIKDGKFEFDTEPIYLDDEFAEANKSRMHKVGDVITVHTGDVGTSAVITENEANSIGFATIVTRPNKEILDSYYLSTFLNTDKHKNWAVQMSTGDGQTNYNLREYTELIVPVPAIDEQKKIAAYITDLNNLITLHQQM